MNYSLSEVIKVPLHYKHIYRKMKVSVLIMIASICFASANNIHSQKAGLSFHFMNTPIKQVINEIEKNSDYVFVLADNIGKETEKKINITVNDTNVENFSILYWQKQVCLIGL